MKRIKEFAIIISISFVGELLHKAIPLAIPASIYGIAILLVLLLTGCLTLSSVEKGAEILISLMPLMFVPIVVGIITVWANLSNILIAFIVISSISTIVVMAVTSKISEKLIKEKKDE